MSEFYTNESSVRQSRLTRISEKEIINDFQSKNNTPKDNNSTIHNQKNKVKITSPLLYEIFFCVYHLKFTSYVIRLTHKYKFMKEIFIKLHFVKCLSFRVQSIIIHSVYAIVFEINLFDQMKRNEEVYS